MRNAAGDAGMRSPHDQNDTRRAIVADLVSLIEHVQDSLKLIERAIAGEAASGNAESSGNIVVLDDVSPRYMTATAALHACDVNLGMALHSLLQAGDDDNVADHPAFTIIEA